MANIKVSRGRFRMSLRSGKNYIARENRKKKSYKPVSRILYPHQSGNGYHLSVSQVTPRNQSAYPPRQLSHFAGPAKNRGLHGISAHKVYPKYLLLSISVSSYLTFSPLSATADSYFLWHFLLSVLPNTRLFTGVLPCAVRTFLPLQNKRR